MTQPRLVAANHSASSTITVAMLMPTLEPSPGVLKRLVFTGPDVCGAGALGCARAVVADRGLIWTASDIGRLPVVDQTQNFFAHPDEVRARLDGTGVASAQKLMTERHVLVDMGDTPRTGAHDDQAAGQE